jgi:hypothetical protein
MDGHFDAPVARDNEVDERVKLESEMDGHFDAPVARENEVDERVLQPKTTEIIKIR